MGSGDLFQFGSPRGHQEGGVWDWPDCMVRFVCGAMVWMMNGAPGRGWTMAAKF